MKTIELNKLYIIPEEGLHTYNKEFIEQMRIERKLSIALSIIGISLTIVSMVIYQKNRINEAKKNI
jgi:ABC-type cobalamin transport system permease subunit